MKTGTFAIVVLILLSAGCFSITPTWAGGLYLFHAGSNTMWLARTYIIAKRDLAFLLITNRGGMEAKAALAGVKEALVHRFARRAPGL